MSEAKSLQKQGIELHCLAFERLLDEGAPERLPATALAHARECARCARSLARARSLEQALARHFANEPASTDAVPAGFTDRVLARVERGEARGVRGLALPAALPWWVHAAGDPAAMLAFGVAALVLWRGHELILAARTLRAGAVPLTAWLANFAHATGLDGVGRAISDALATSGTPWATSTGVTLGLVPVMALLAIAGWRAGERLVVAATVGAR